MQKQVVLAFCILFMFAVVSLQASPVSNHNSTDHGRQKRDIQGLFDMIGGFFTKDASGKSQAGQLVDGAAKSFMSAVSGLGKVMGAGGTSG